MQIRYTSRLSSEHLGALQELMFFNEDQQRFRSAIVSSIEQFGEPMIKDDGGLLRLHTSRLGEVQALFVLQEDTDVTRPIAAMAYAISAEDTITVLHIAVDADFASDGPYAERMITLELFRRLIEVAKQVKDIQKIIVIYSARGSFEIPIRRPSIR